ncbi:NERD domain-containing protein/DEAD/DEAH box helicase [Bradyrhizobium arachidis]|uniref:DEAD/DEAH box helicase n=1 Tax=Bradyrhizobium TaxID=374 RepID=UPI002162887D|nr:MULTISPECIES: NERD domain-containing protein/DEAD/DEAH box helicase [Bradyrhizobium]MDN4988261.1 NERD domain-containing protein/DEAD/DEAH box helicase [Bradyrhizobium sp. WYCCWR 13022]UVO38098.1 NERD domain-containing protein/DEAD/DEAH box helicase [Bradyrhizobium arachidis]
MATLIPSLGFARFDTRGELRLAERLKDFLEENAVVWHNLPVGPRNRHPDFIIVHPANGLLVLEVKDWRLESIVSADKGNVELLTARGIVRESNPLEQARKYTFDVVRTLERDGQLLFPPGHRFMGKSIVPFGFGVVFTNITRRQFDQTDLKEVLAGHLCVFKDEMTESADPEEFCARLWCMVSPRFEEPLSMPQFDRLRALLFPEIRIRQIALPLGEAPVPDPSDRTLAVMDMHQEQIARSLGEGHRIIRGVAGSGKTLILAFRAEYLARGATRPVLILCYANGIAGRLEDAMQDRGVEHRVQVLTFHGWCYRMLRTYGIPAPSERDYPDYAKRLAASVSEVMKAVDQGHIPMGQYDAVLIDEAHDFEPQWLALAAKMVNPRTKALMVVYDDIQAIYKGRERPVWKQLGIEASGRTTVLKVNYRNTAQIVAFARRFASDVIGAPGTTADDENPILLPEDAGRQGLAPDVRQCVSIDAEAHCVAEWFLGRKKAGYEWPQMACLYPEHWIGERVAQILAKHDVPIDMAKNNKNRISTKRVAVRLLSMHTAKGLEFPCVAIAGLGMLGRHGETIEECVRLTYVGVTRATHEALLTYSSESALVQRLIA